MAKAAAALVSALCILAVAAVAQGHNVFSIEGDVYCDPCRVQFLTQISDKIPGATVKVECVDIETKAVTFSAEGVTDAAGHYNLRVEGEHQNDMCTVKPVKSPRADCSEPMNDVDGAQIECTENSGISSDIRYANPIGFMTRESDGRCMSVLQETFSD